MPRIVQGTSAFNNERRQRAAQAAAARREEVIQSPKNAITRGRQLAERSLQLRAQKFAESERLK